MADVVRAHPAVVNPVALWDEKESPTEKWHPLFTGVQKIRRMGVRPHLVI